MSEQMQDGPPVIAPDIDPKVTRAQRLDELWPPAGEALRIRIQASVASEGAYRTLAGSAWNFKIARPTPGFGLELLAVYDTLEELLEVYGPGNVAHLLKLGQRALDGELTK